METLHLWGGRPLYGFIPVSGSKNAALPLMASSLLTEEPYIIENIPHLQDVLTLKKLLEHHGVCIKVLSNGSWYFDSSNITQTCAPYEIVKQMRASFLVLGPLLARCGEAIVSLPGGCAIGARPVDFHLKGLEALGADLFLEQGYIHAKAPSGGLVGGVYSFPKVSVTGTMNVLMAACLAKGETILENVAKEPEVLNLVEALRVMGANIEGEGTCTLKIRGVSALKKACVKVIPDRLEAVTYMIAGAITRGKITVGPIAYEHVALPTKILKDMGVRVDVSDCDATITVDATAVDCFIPVHLKTSPYPGLATDLQAQFMVLSTQANGTSSIIETIYENRFMHIPELRRMGAKIHVNDSCAFVEGPILLHGAPVMATDLRASVCLVLAGLAAQGETVVSRLYHLDRGYACLEQKLLACGASLERQKNALLATEKEEKVRLGSGECMKNMLTNRSTLAGGAV